MMSLYKKISLLRHQLENNDQQEREGPISQELPEQSKTKAILLHSKRELEAAA
jgi:hypothetical protein